MVVPRYSLRPEWRNGRRRGLKIPFPQGSAGSSPASGKLILQLVARLTEGRKGRFEGYFNRYTHMIHADPPHLSQKRTHRLDDVRLLTVRSRLGYVTAES
jgi:hypothetical protein